MFNPYRVRPIGSPQFEEHLMTLTAIAEEKREEDQALIGYPIILRAERKQMGYDPMQDGWYRLYATIIAVACVDYLESYECRLRYESDGDFARAEVFESRCIEMENHYFRQDEELELLLDVMLRRAIHNKKDFTLQERIWRIRRMTRDIKERMY